ncbi:MAG: molybdenum cofactor biosynthesis protein MoaE [Anaerolineales bacterium]|nr:molybdenum cofactor biosynthesis protein MoaE [Anaerolineales bacterium]
MEVTVLYFALLRDRAGSRQDTFSLSEGACIADLLALILDRRPALEQGLKSAVYAVNREFAGLKDMLHDGDEIAVFPPVSGGMGDQPVTIVRLTEEAFDLNDINRALVSDEVGAICLFTGVVRAETSRGGKSTTTELHYEAYREMALEKMEQVTLEIRSRWPEVKGIAILHRLGDFEPGTPTVVTACSASHRDTGVFEAARYGIDRIKQIVPIWKQERGPDGEIWVEGGYIPGEEDRNG